MSVGVQRRDRVIKNGRNRKQRAKTFKTEDAANAYAKANGIASYKLVNIKSTESTSKKIRIVTE